MSKRLPAPAFLLVLLLLITVRVQAQQPVVAFWETDAPPEGGWTVGDPIPLRLRATYTPDLEVILPELPGQWGAFEVREQALSEVEMHDNGSVTVAREATVVLWAPGEHETPPFAVRYRDADGELHQVPVPPLSVTVASVLPENADDGSEIEKRDLKPQASLPRPPVWPWVLATVPLATLLFLAGRRLMRQLRRRRGTRPEAVEPVDDRLPEEIAYEELERISGLDLPAQGEFKRHYTLVADCVRVYLEGLYHIPAMDRTTGELMTALRRVRVDGAATTLARELLEEADLVKFAKLRPPIKRARESVAQARRLVDITKPDRTMPGGTQGPITQQPGHNT